VADVSVSRISVLNCKSLFSLARCFNTYILHGQKMILVVAIFVSFSLRGKSRHSLGDYIDHRGISLNSSVLRI
jgi:hypothetical protein